MQQVTNVFPQENHGVLEDLWRLMSKLKQGSKIPLPNIREIQMKLERNGLRTCEKDMFCNGYLKELGRGESLDGIQSRKHLGETLRP